MKASMKKAEWIQRQMEDSHSADDIYDALLGNITSPVSFLREIDYWSNLYEEQLRRGNARADQN